MATIAQKKRYLLRPFHDNRIFLRKVSRNVTKGFFEESLNLPKSW